MSPTHDVGVVEMPTKRVGPRKPMLTDRANTSVEPEMNIANMFDYMGLQDTAAAGAARIDAVPLAICASVTRWRRHFRMVCIEVHLDSAA